MLKKPPEIGGLTHKIRKIVFSYFRCPVFAFSVSRFTRHQHCVTLYAKGLVCEADSLGSHGYIYVAIYPGDSPETGGMAR